MRVLFALGLSALSATPALAQSCPEFTTADHLRALGSVVSLGDMGKFFGIGLGGIGLLMVIGWIISKLNLFSAVVWEVLGYAAAIALITAGLWVPGVFPALAPHIGAAVIVGSLLAGGMIVITGNLHEITPNPTTFFGTLFVLYSGIAVAYQSVPVAFFAVLALLGLAGFSVVADTLTYAFFFREKKLPGTTALAVLLAATFLVLKGTGTHIPYIGIFETGALWAGSLVGAIGLLIVSSVYYRDSDSEDGRSFPTFARQLMAFAVLAAGIVFGAIYDSDVVMYVSAVFFFLNVIERPYEWAPRSFFAYSILTTLIGLALYSGGTWVHNHVDMLQAYVEQVRG